MAAPADGLHDPYLPITDPYKYGNIKLYTKEIVGIQVSDSYDITRYKWADFYQELEDVVSTFVLKSAVLIMKSSDGGHAITEVKGIILSYLSTT